MAADSAVMVIDASKGVEAQTRKLFKVCAMRHIPIFTFINKLDRDANDTFDLLDDIEKELGIPTCPINWPIGSGKKFRGVYDRETGKVLTFSDTMKGTREGIEEIIDLEDPHLDDVLDEEQKEQLLEEIELLDGASAEFDQELVDIKGRTLSSMLWFRSYQLWCGNLFETFPENDLFSSSKKRTLVKLTQ